MVSFIVYTRMLVLGVLYTVPAVLFVLIYAFFVLFNTVKVRRMMRLIILGFGKLMVRVAIAPYVKVITEYEDHKETPQVAIYICNHRSASDAFLVSTVKTVVPAFQVMKGWPMKIPVLGLCAKVAGYFPVTEQSFEETCQKSRELLLGEQAPVFIYPEGTRSGNRSINQFHGTFFRIAKELALPIVPVAIAGNENIPDLKFRIRRGTVMVKVLKAIPAETVCGMSLYALKNMVRNRLAEETRLMDERLDGNDA